MDVMQPEPHVALIAEDDQDVRDLAAALLEETELDVVEVESADAALALPPGAGRRGRDDVRRRPPAR
jgi:CheY-like chemotaxis protein